MKPYPPIPSFYHLIFLSLSFWNCNRPVPPPEVHGAGAVEKMWPQEWMYAQRAYPYPSINREAVRDAWRQAKEATTTGRTAAQWEPAGPVNVGGRITALVLHPADQNIIYVGTSAGGIFKTTNKGATWTAVFEEAGAMSVGALAMAPSDPEVLYMGAGEANGSATSGAFFGDGVYKTTDGGNTWTHIGLANTQHIGRIAIDPVNADRVYVAAAGVLYGKNDERGLYRTTDGGTNWEQVLFVSDSTACIDVVVNPVNASIVYAATWERIRYPWQRHYGGPTSRVYRSFDGGNSWEQLTNGLPPDSDQTGRIGLAIAPSNPAVLYACYTTDPVTNTFDGIYKSEDAGSSWTRVDQSDISFVFSSFGWFFGNLRVHPTESNDVSLLGVLLVRSTDGGATWADATFNMHVDFHALEFHPQNPFFVVAGNDGGVYISEDGGFNWQHAQGLPNNLIYNCEIDHLQPNHLYAGFQDQGTQRTLTGAVDDFERILGADGFQIIVNPTNNNIIYAETQFGRVYRSTNGGENMTCIFNCTNDPGLRSNWNTPIAMDPSDPAIIYVGTQYLHKSTDQGDHFTIISSDLTAGQHPSGTSSYGTLTTIAVAPTDPQTIYTGSDDGKVHVTFDGGANWEDISSGLPHRYVTAVAVHPNDPMTAFVTLSGYRKTDYQPHLLKTTNGGLAWEDLSANLPEAPANDIIVHPDDPNLLFVATDMGVWYSNTGGNFWELPGEGLPPTIVNDLDLHAEEQILLAATFGRSMLQLDLSDISPVGAVHTNRPDAPAPTVWPNPVRQGARITVSFYLLQPSSGEIQLLQQNGQLIKKTTNQYFSKGKNVKTMETTSLPPGHYLVRIKTKSNALVAKMVLE